MTVTVIHTAMKSRLSQWSSLSDDLYTCMFCVVHLYAVSQSVIIVFITLHLSSLQECAIPDDDCQPYSRAPTTCKSSEQVDLTVWILKLTLLYLINYPWPWPWPRGHSHRHNHDHLHGHRLYQTQNNTHSEIPENPCMPDSSSLKHEMKCKAIAFIMFILILVIT